MYPSPVASRDHGKVHRIASGPSGGMIALATDAIDGELRTLDARSLAPRERILLGPMRTARACALSPDDTLLAVATADDVTLFDLEARSVRWRVPLAGDEAAACFSPDNESVAVGRGDGALALLSVRDGRELGTLPLESEPRSATWEALGLTVLSAHELVLSGGTTPPRRVSFAASRGECQELCSIDAARVALAGSGPSGVWIELRARRDGALLTELSLDGDRHAEGIAFSGGVLFIATEGGVYRADPPHEQLVRWLPPLGGAHDPTRLARVGEDLIAVSARDVRLFRASS